jgi:multisubunit Na+/H+ antiporter MnhG subunit
MKFIRENKIFSCLYFLAVLVTLLAVYKLGFEESAQQVASQTERLRDVTFHIWDNYAPSKHGYLVFLSLDQFNKDVAYSNHSTAFLFYMYGLYKIEMLIPAFKMRVVSALFNMISLAGVVFYIVSKVAPKSISLIKGFLMILAVIFMLSMPDYWISAARFNVDNTFPLIFTMLALVSFFIWQDKGKGRRVLISIFLFAVFSPISAAILGIALSLYSLRREGLDSKLLKLGAVAIFMGCLLYLQAPVTAKMLSFTSVNSGWLFRSGLDGDTSYFSNVFMSIVLPYYPRPLHFIALPVLLLLAQVMLSRIFTEIEKPKGKGNEVISTSSDTGIFYFLIFSQYIFTLLLWPQAIAIHPYLYDYLLLAPVSVLIVLNFVNLPEHFNFSRLWVLLLIFSISFNFQQIAQAKCNNCTYPSWSAKK